ncbi:MAG: hypothetical protein K0Q76_3655 [Panacagrimonas sp.]|nr:hypothetical protein [Panacagrimonas sp.]
MPTPRERDPKRTVAEQGRNEMGAQSRPGAPAGGDAAARAAGGEIALRDLLRNLFDFEMREIVTTRMLPLIYRFAVMAMAALVVLGVVTAFIQSLWMGLTWLLFGPIVFLILVVVVRVFLEFVMAVFRMLVYIEILDRRTSTIEGHTEEVVQDLPRIQFWKFSLGKRRTDPR